MKLLRAITQRGFKIGTAGWFTILKPTPWFPASRLPGRFRYRSTPTTRMSAADQAVSINILIPSTKERRLGRSALVVVAAIAITSALLWWIMHP